MTPQLNVLDAAPLPASEMERLDWLEYWMFWNPFYTSTEFAMVNAYKDAFQAEANFFCSPGFSQTHWYCQALTDDLAKLSEMGRVDKHFARRFGNKGHVSYFYSIAKHRDIALMLDTRPRPSLVIDTKS